MSATPPREAPETVPTSKAKRRENTKLVVGLVLGALVVAFALLNLDTVDINWILGTWKTPLIVVILVSALVGAGIDRAFVVRKRKKRG